MPTEGLGMWNVWSNEADGVTVFYATRRLRRALTQRELGAGLVHTLHADNKGHLLDLMEDQARLAERLEPLGELYDTMMEERYGPLENLAREEYGSGFPQ